MYFSTTSDGKHVSSSSKCPNCHCLFMSASHCLPESDLVSIACLCRYDPIIAHTFRQPLFEGVLGVVHICNNNISILSHLHTPDQLLPEVGLFLKSYKIGYRAVILLSDNGIQMFYVLKSTLKLTEALILLSPSCTFEHAPTWRFVCGHAAKVILFAVISSLTLTSAAPFPLIKGTFFH